MTEAVIEDTKFFFKNMLYALGMIVVMGISILIGLGGFNLLIDNSSVFYILLPIVVILINLPTFIYIRWASRRIAIDIYKIE